MHLETIQIPQTQQMPRVLIFGKKMTISHVTCYYQITLLVLRLLSVYFLILCCQSDTLNILNDSFILCFVFIHDNLE